tara:strand:- start:1583 stop:2890 length:1308 start_codon:yes stop_codon:yes gene_type:complete
MTIGNKVLFWHRRDLRTEDNAGLFKALSENSSVVPVFIFDQTILNRLEKNDPRVSFIHKELEVLKEFYKSRGSDLLIYHGKPIELIPKIAEDLSCKKVFTNRDYEPYAIKRDRSVFEKLKNKNIDFIGTKDHVVFEKNEVLKDNGTPYLVFTPYSKKWKTIFAQKYIPQFDSNKLLDKLYSASSYQKMLSLKDIGFEESHTFFPAKKISRQTIEQYQERRNFPSQNGTSRIGLHLRFGTISIRSVVNKAVKSSTTYLNELIWRDFYQMLIYHFPHSAKNSFRKEYDLIEWNKDMDLFQKWCDGKTGYPIVDAGMRELNQTGYMHNRVRMIVASFLTKHLLIDWRLGEAYFASKLLDYELASNIGGWQWASGSGCDAAPYFRIFNPITQQQKFDKEMKYIKKWIPEINSSNYPDPIVNHKMARERALERYKTGLKK